MEEMTSAGQTQLPLPVRLRSNILRAPWFFLSTGFFGSLSLLASCFEKDGRLQHRIARIWARVSLMIAGAPLTVTGGEHLPPVAIYVANHASFMDIPVIFSSLPFPFRILAKESLWKWPFIGWHLNRSGQIPVEEDAAGSIAGLNRALRALRSGTPLFIFPEGGRTADGNLQPFMDGPAFLSIRAHVPIVPMALVGTRELLPMHGGHFRPRPVKLVIGEPIDSTQYTIRQVSALTARLYAEISALRREYSEQPQPAEQGALQPTDVRNVNV
jgi:1-acyl-sn-glycerol-3-phosphate acyltransferase